MGVTRLAALLVAVGVVVLSVGVGLFDWRAGVVVFGCSCVAAGVWTLIKE